MTEQNLIQSVPFGSQFWDKIVNNNFSILDQRKDKVTEVPNGITTVNLKRNPDFMGLYYIQLEGYKHIFVIISSFDVNKDNWGQKVGSIPAQLAPTYLMHTTGDRQSTVDIDPQGNLVIWSNDTGERTNICCIADYLRKD